MAHPQPTVRPIDPQDGPLDLDLLLRRYGPHAGGEPDTDDELGARLEAFGRAFWRVPSRTLREMARQIWIDHLRGRTLPAVDQPWRVVDEAIRAGAPEGVLRSSWRWYTDAELDALPPVVELVRGHIPERGLVMLYGPSGAGKTHVALDLAQSVATGVSWHGNAVRRGPAAYILAEGIGGLAARVHAWKQARGWTASTGVRFLPQPVQLLEPAEARRLIEELTGWDPAPKLVTIDTVSWCLAPADENSTRDMSMFVAAIGELREATGATVQVVHHSGHNETRARGSSALFAAMDTVVQVKGEDSDIVLTCEKQRDGVPFPPLRLRLHPAAESVAPELVLAHERDEIRDSDRVALAALEAACLDGESLPTGKWQSLSGLPERTFYRCRQRLAVNGLIRVEGEGRNTRNFPALTDNERDGDGASLP